MLSPRMHGRQEGALAGLALTLCLACALPLAAQLDRHRNGPPPPAEEEKIAALDAHTSTLPVLDAGEMSAADRALLQQREVDVSSAAAFYGFDISDSHWTYQQIVCRSLPDHMMLSFENGSVEHGPSHFVAVVPANGEKVQVVTEYAHGLLPFRAAWEKSTAYDAFNRMTATDRGEHELGPQSHWLNLGMCFVALTGHLPRVPGGPRVRMRCPIAACARVGVHAAQADPAAEPSSQSVQHDDKEDPTGPQSPPPCSYRQPGAAVPLACKASAVKCHASGAEGPNNSQSRSTFRAAILARRGSVACPFTRTVMAGFRP